MPLRWKVFLLLLLFAAVPLLLIRWSNNRAFGYMEQDLVARTNSTLVERARFTVQQQVLDHARHIALHKELVSLAVEMQAAGMLSSTGPMPPRHGMGGMLLRRDTRDSHHPMGAEPPGPASSSPSLPKGPHPPQQQDFVNDMQPVFEAVADRFGDTLLWQAARSAAMPFALHPKPDNFKEGKRLVGVLEALPPSSMPKWTDPFIDPVTGKQAMAVSMGNHTAGLAVCAVSVGPLLTSGHHLDALSPRLGILLIRVAEDTPTIDLLASRWHPADPEAGAHTIAWIQDRTSLSNALKLITDLRQHQSGSILIRRPAEENAPELLWAYAPIGKTDLALVASLPIEDITQEAYRMRGFISDRLGALRAFNVTSMAVMLVLAFLCSLAVSRQVQQRILRLLQGFREVAQGNFDARVLPGSRDEIGHLAESFNTMVPALEERFHIMKSLDLAHAMQHRLLPHAPPEVPGVEMVGVCRYSEATGGDFYDFLSRENNTLDVVVGDVSGHGLPAALLMATTRSCLRQRVAKPVQGVVGLGLACSITDVNRQLCHDIHPAGDFVTLLWMRCDPHAGSVAWIRAGHDPALLYDPASGAFESLEGAGIPLGIMPNWEFQECSHSWRPGQLLAIGTDGIWETENSEGQWYGKQRFQDVLHRLAQEGRTLESIRDGILLDVEAFRQGAPQVDDVTLVLVRLASGFPQKPQPDNAVQSRGQCPTDATNAAQSCPRGDAS